MKEENLLVFLNKSVCALPHWVTLQVLPNIDEILVKLSNVGAVSLFSSCFQVQQPLMTLKLQR